MAQKINKQDYLLSTFGEWTVIDLSKNTKKVICKCSCGKIKEVDWYNLTHGLSKSCGCKRNINKSYSSNEFLIGSKIGEYTILEKTKQRTNRGEILWKCQCSCGNINLIRSSTLKRGISHCQTHKENYIGKQFGRLIVMEDSGERYQNRVIWKCKCECGNYVNVPASRLQSGNTKSCGCLVKEKAAQTRHNAQLNDLQGQKFGKLTVLRLSTPEELREDQVNDYKSYWRCLCDCGRECNIIRNNLLNGNSTSCGHHKISKGENKIVEILKNNNIPFVQHDKSFGWRYPDSNYLIEFDFLVNNNYIIEYDGKQHFMPIEFYGGEKEFSKTQNKDKIRNSLCKQNNIPLIRIPYTCDLEKLTIIDLIPESSPYLVI